LPKLDPSHYVCRSAEIGAAAGSGERAPPLPPGLGLRRDCALSRGGTRDAADSAMRFFFPTGKVVIACGSSSRVERRMEEDGPSLREVESRAFPSLAATAVLLSGSFRFPFFFITLQYFSLLFLTSNKEDGQSVDPIGGRIARASSFLLSDAIIDEGPFPLWLRMGSSFPPPLYVGVAPSQ